MIVHECEQGTPEWFESRAGVITASMFSEVRKRVGGLSEQQAEYVQLVLSGHSADAAAERAGYSKPPTSKRVEAALRGEQLGDFTDAAKAYAFKLAVERIGKTTLDAEGFKPWQAERGNALEEECRRRHEADISELADLAGFVTTDCGRFGCSADSFINHDGGGEYKAFLAPVKLHSIIIDGDWGDVMDQAQGCLMITERDWWDMCLYCPHLATVGKDFLRKRSYRDDAYIAALWKDLEAFDALVEEYRQQIIGDQPEPEVADHPATEIDPEQHPELDIAF